MARVITLKNYKNEFKRKIIVVIQSFFLTFAKNTTHNKMI